MGLQMRLNQFFSNIQSLEFLRNGLSRKNPADSSDKPSVAKIQKMVKKRLGIKHEDDFQRVWDQAIAAHQIQWPKEEQLTPEILQQLEGAIRSTLVYLGEGIEAVVSDSQVGEMVRYLLGRGTFSSDWVHWKNVRGVLFKKDPALLKEMREEFRSILKACANRHPKNAKEDLLLQTFIGNVIALLPYSYPEEGEGFIIPQKIDGQWKSCHYTVDRRIELMESQFASPLVHYGFVSNEGPPLLSFLGTTYPAGDGFIASIFSSFVPGFSVGEVPYLLDKDNISCWLEGKEGVRLFGVSLGGALAFHTLKDHRQKIDQVHAYSPVGLFARNWKETYDDSPEINIYYQSNDIVPRLGIFPVGKKVTIYRLFPENIENAFNAHFRVYTGGKKVQILRSNPEYENSKFSRGILTSLHVASAIFFFMPLLSLHLIYRVASSLPHDLVSVGKFSRTSKK
jgi:hypothetical protein